jgi:hypothetical protein
MINFSALTLAAVTVAGSGLAQTTPHPRERDLGLPIGGTAGRLDAITDVAGVEVGYSTLISGEGRLMAGQGPVRTGVTVVFPRGKENLDPVFASWYSYNGNGEMTGTTWITEGGFLEGPVAITNTHSVGIATPSSHGRRPGAAGLRSRGSCRLPLRRTMAVRTTSTAFTSSPSTS